MLGVMSDPGVQADPGHFQKQFWRWRGAQSHAMDIFVKASLSQMLEVFAWHGIPYLHLALLSAPFNCGVV